MTEVVFQTDLLLYHPAASLQIGLESSINRPGSQVFGEIIQVFIGQMTLSDGVCDGLIPTPLPPTEVFELLRASLLKLPAPTCHFKQKIFPDPCVEGVSCLKENLPERHGEIHLTLVPELFENQNISSVN